ncbi:MAG: tryptophan--tRNA ligase [Firmicutes bacterium]|nr:tryptophan--tRNA ligase [Bacillota bacterium]
MEKKLTIFSGIKPSGRFTLGNYIGAVKNWQEMQSRYNSIFSVVDLHALTVDINPDELRENIYAAIANLIACGLDPNKSTIYCQSHISGHAELGWLLNCITWFGEAGRMTQFKDKSRKGAQVSVGLFDYPVLMAADIMLFDAALVPIGEDQRQHVELSRTLAVRFNNKYGNTFVVPEGYFPKLGAKIYDLQEPTKKMSKSDADASGCVLLEDSPEVIRSKIKRAVTDSDGKIVFSKDKPGVSNLLTIYCTLTNKTPKQAEEYFGGKGYGALKNEVADAVIATLAEPQEIFKRLMNDKAELDRLAKLGAEKLQKQACAKLAVVKQKMGLI